MLEYQINVNSLQESNIFLRKLWSELNDIRPMGWNMYPYKDKNHITIGCSNFGEIAFDYTRKGCIKKLYIDNSIDKDAITQAVQNAQHNNLSEYTILLELIADKRIDLLPRTYEKCRIYSKDGALFLLAEFKAYSSWDAEIFFPSKLLSICSILYAYTHNTFHIKSSKIAKNRLVVTNTPPVSYNYQWIDSDECPTAEGQNIILPDECFKLIMYVMDDEVFIEDIELLLNSSNLLFTAQSMMEEVSFPYASIKADIYNALACSSLEPLSLILDKNTEQCSLCGNKVFSISSKIKKMCSHYFDEGFAKHVSNVIYKNRSVFLHNGQPESTQRSNKVFCPQVNPTTGMIMYPGGRLRYELFDWSTFLLRNIAHDYFSGSLQQSQ